MVDNYQRFEVTADSVIILGQDTAITLSFREARELVEALQRHLGNPAKRDEDPRQSYPAPDMKYGQAL